MIYDEARSLIKDGDHVGVCGVAWASRLTHAAQRLAGLRWAQVTHSGIAIWADGRLFIAEMSKGGNVIKPLSQYKHLDLVVSRAPVPIDRLKLADALDETLKTHRPYGWFDLLKLGLLRGPALRLGLSKPLATDSLRDLVCSMFSAWVYRLLGWERALPGLCFPAEVVMALGEPVLVIKAL